MFFSFYELEDDDMFAVDFLDSDSHRVSPESRASSDDKVIVWDSVEQLIENAPVNKPWSIDISGCHDDAAIGHAMRVLAGIGYSITISDGN